MNISEILKNKVIKCIEYQENTDIIIISFYDGTNLQISWREHDDYYGGGDDGDGLDVAVENMTLEQKFKKLHHQWHNETMFISDSDVIANHPSLREIISMAIDGSTQDMSDVLQFIFKYMQTTSEFGDHWFSALIEITGKNPVPEEERGQIEKMNNRWIDWAKENGYLAAA